ncbi:ATP-binding protein [bacterium]|nr:ATP-binding protein [bacterium]MBR1748029.1 ATP-binding protein [Clostridia bacterium]
MFIGEDNNTELKESLNNALPKEIVAFLNTEGGLIYIGITNNYEVIGLNDIDENMRKIKL